MPHEAKITLTDDGEIQPAPTNLDELLILLRSGASWLGAPMAAGEIDGSSLPTFGGADPEDTIDVWSWDESRLIVTGSASLEIVSRAEWTQMVDG